MAIASRFIGRNGEGKSSLLKMIADLNRNISSAYVPQIIENFDSLSGGERFNKSLSIALGKNPSILLLDEPTNHLESDESGKISGKKFKKSR